MRAVAADKRDESPVLACDSLKEGDFSGQEKPALSEKEKEIRLDLS